MEGQFYTICASNFCVSEYCIRANYTNFGGRHTARWKVNCIRSAQATFASVSIVSIRSHSLRSGATFCSNRKTAAQQQALPSHRHSFQSLAVVMGILTGLTSSADGRRTERSEGAPIPTICCGACAARLFDALLAVCSRRRQEHARDVVREACFAACW